MPRFVFSLREGRRIDPPSARAWALVFAALLAGGAAGAGGDARLEAPVPMPRLELRPVLRQRPAPRLLRLRGAGADQRFGGAMPPAHRDVWLRGNANDPHPGEDGAGLEHIPSVLAAARDKVRALPASVRLPRMPPSEAYHPPAGAGTCTFVPPLAVLLVMWDHCVSHCLKLCPCEATPLGLACGNERLTAQLRNILTWGRQIDDAFDANLAGGVELGGLQGAASTALLGLMHEAYGAVDDPGVESIIDKLAAIAELRKVDLQHRLDQAKTAAAGVGRDTQHQTKEWGSGPPPQQQLRFWAAADTGDAAEVARLAGGGGVIMDAADPKHWAGLRAVHMAAGNGHVAVISALVRRGAGASLSDKFGETALHAAARTHQTAAVALLLQRCPAGERNCWGQTALHVALDCSTDPDTDAASEAEERRAGPRRDACAGTGAGGAQVATVETLLAGGAEVMPPMPLDGRRCTWRRGGGGCGRRGCCWRPGRM